MRIAIHDAEREYLKNKTFPNFALMKISAYHKAKGDTVEWWSALLGGQYDKVYSSKVFDFTPTNIFLPPGTIKGGTGYGLYDNLPHEIDNCSPDYSIYPNCDYAIGFLTRGCPNNCSYCIVPKKEGGIKPYSAWQSIVRHDTNKIVLMDNNVLACHYGITQLKELSHTNFQIDLNQGMDITFLTDEICSILRSIKWIKYIRFSCDKSYQLPHFERMVELFKRHKLPLSRVFIYVLVQKDIDDADKRIQALHKLCRSFSVYAQAERNGLLGIEPNKAQLEFAQRYVYGRCYKKEAWVDYCRRKKF